MIANKVVVPGVNGFETGASAFHGHFPHQARLYEVTQIVVGGGARTARVHTIDRFEDLRSRGMPVVFRQEGHDGEALRRAPKTGVFESSSDGIGVHEVFRLYLS
jgi:hypothetical protein